MKRRLWLSGAIAVLIWVWASAASAATFYWRNPGRDPFLGRIRSVDDLSAKFQGNQGLFAERLRVADPTLPAGDIAAGTAAAFWTHRGIRPETLRDGTRVAWMIDGHGVRRDVVVVGDRPGYRVSIPSPRDGRMYDFHWASICGNVTPLGVRPFPRPPAPRISSTVRPYREVIVLVRPVPVFLPPPMPLVVPFPYFPPPWMWP
jgi:hypothetical protein